MRGVSIVKSYNYASKLEDEEPNYGYWTKANNEPPEIVNKYVKFPIFDISE